jgi:uncharacterized protein (DUF1501 family)
VDLGGGRLAVDGYQQAAISLTSVGEFRIETSFDSEARSAAYARIMQHPSTSAAAERSRIVRKAAVEQSEVLGAAVAGYEAAAEYPQNNLVAASLLQCAQLVAANLDVRALSVGYNGFDTHAGQSDGAYHEGLLQDVSGGVKAFYDDLAGHGLAEKVVTVIFSEFGRRVRENNDAGTDHGLGSVWFVVGGSVTGGIYGEHPGLAAGNLAGNSLAVTTDFRRVYATIVAGHLGGDPEEVLGGSFASLGFMR